MATFTTRLVGVALLSLVCLALCSQQVEAVQKGTFQRRFSATPVVYGELGAELRQKFASMLELKAQEKPIHYKRVAATAAVRKGAPNVKNTVNTETDEGESVDLTTIKRECPPRRCEANATCPLAGGVCCSTGKVCCPSGSVCLTTDPPTCVTDAQNDEFRCAEQECNSGFTCPHSGVEDCCLGGDTCCRKGFKCKATNPPSCVRLMSAAEAAEEAKHQANLFKRKKAEKRQKRALRSKKHERKMKGLGKDLNSKLGEKGKKHAAKLNGRRKKMREATAKQRKKLSKDKEANRKEQAKKRKESSTKSGNARRESDQKRRKHAVEQRAKVVARQKAIAALKHKRQEARKKQIERARKANERKHKTAQARKLDFSGLCTFDKHCSPGWSNRGLVGIIMTNHAYGRNPFHHGGQFNGGWRWTHPYLCCGTKRVANNHPVFFVAHRCPGGTTDLGHVGVIFVNSQLSRASHVAHLNGGGGFNGGWTWRHPKLCKAPNVYRAQKGVCMFARSCPSGWRNAGLSGIIMNNHHYNKNPFQRGGGFNGGWTWTHPHMCCRL